MLFSLRVEEKLLPGLVHTCVCLDNVVRLGLGFPKVPEWLELSWCPPRWVLLGSILTGGLIPLVFFYYVPFPWHIATRNITQNLLLEFCISHAHDKKKCVGIYTFCSPLYLYKGDLHYLIAQNAPVHGVSHFVILRRQRGQYRPLSGGAQLLNLHATSWTHVSQDSFISWVWMLLTRLIRLPFRWHRLLFSKKKRWHRLFAFDDETVIFSAAVGVRT